MFKFIEGSAQYGIALVVENGEGDEILWYEKEAKRDEKFLKILNTGKINSRSRYGNVTVHKVLKAWKVNTGECVELDNGKCLQEAAVEVAPNKGEKPWCMAKGTLPRF